MMEDLSFQLSHLLQTDVFEAGPEFTEVKVEAESSFSQCVRGLHETISGDTDLVKWMTATDTETESPTTLSRAKQAEGSDKRVDEAIASVEYAQSELATLVSVIDGVLGTGGSPVDLGYRLLPKPSKDSAMKTGTVELKTLRAQKCKHLSKLSDILDAARSRLVERTLVLNTFTKDIYELSANWRLSLSTEESAESSAVKPSSALKKSAVSSVFCHLSDADKSTVSMNATSETLPIDYATDSGHELGHCCVLQVDDSSTKAVTGEVLVSGCGEVNEYLFAENLKTLYASFWSALKLDAVNYSGVDFATDISQLRADCERISVHCATHPTVHLTFESSQCRLNLTCDKQKRSAVAFDGTVVAENSDSDEEKDVAEFARVSAGIEMNAVTTFFNGKSGDLLFKMAAKMAHAQMCASLRKSLMQFCRLHSEFRVMWNPSPKILEVDFSVSRGKRLLLNCALSGTLIEVTVIESIESIHGFAMPVTSFKSCDTLCAFAKVLNDLTV